MKGKKKSFAEKIKNEGWLRIDCHPLAVWFGSTFVTVFLLELLSRKSLISVFYDCACHLFADVFNEALGLCQRSCGDFLGCNWCDGLCTFDVSNHAV